jgi:CheY-like chemotaxis protein
VNRLFLIADDDRDDAELFAEALGEHDPPVSTVHTEDGPEMFAYLNDTSKQRPDIIFLDINLPDMSGWECLDKLKSEERYKSIPVIMYSTSSHAEDKRFAKELGAVGFVTKPPDFKLLIKILGQIADAKTGDLKKVLARL